MPTPPPPTSGRAVRIVVLVWALLGAGLVSNFFLVRPTPPARPVRTRGEPTVCRVTRGEQTVAQLAPNAAPASAAAGDVLRCAVAPSRHEHLELWAQAGADPPLRLSAQVIDRHTELTGIELGGGEIHIYLVRSDGPPADGAVLQAIREGSRTPRLRVEAFGVHE